MSLMSHIPTHILLLSLNKVGQILLDFNLNMQYSFHSSTYWINLCLVNMKPMQECTSRYTSSTAVHTLASAHKLRIFLYSNTRIVLILLAFPTPHSSQSFAFLFRPPSLVS